MRKDKYIVISGGNINWRVRTDSPKIIRFKSNKEVALVNPMYYHSKKWQGQIANLQRFINVNDEYHIVTKGLIFKKYVEEIDPMKFIEFLRELIYHVRIISKQAALNPNNFFHAYSVFEIDDLEKNAEVQETEGMMIRGDYYSTMVTWEMIKEADNRMRKNYQTPIYIEILTDAYNGLINHEYRKTILYSSIAIESMLAIKLDEDYEKIIKKGKKTAYRISKFTTANGEVLKDPIYQRLKEKTNFSFLLHERPLYIWKRSVLLENENLYNAAKQLYSTRNKIVHWGEPDSTISNLLKIDDEGANQAFSIARKLFKWAGVDEFDSILLFELIELKKNERPTKAMMSMPPKRRHGT